LGRNSLEIKYSIYTLVVEGDEIEFYGLFDEYSEYLCSVPIEAIKQILDKLGET